MKYICMYIIVIGQAGMTDIKGDYWINNMDHPHVSGIEPSIETLSQSPAEDSNVMSKPV